MTRVEREAQRRGAGFAALANAAQQEGRPFVGLGRQLQPSQGLGGQAVWQPSQNHPYLSAAQGLLQRPQQIG